ncbi:TPA: restriction endonuclease subunit S [Klebsiella pneumoniae]
MSELSYLEKLLDGVEVEWKTLGTVIKTVTASSKLKSQAYRASGKLPIVDQGIKFIAGYTDEDVTPIEAGKYIIFGDHSEHIKYVDFPFVQGADGLKILSPISANAKYIYHAFLKFYKKELSYKRHWSTAQQTLIPIPCPDNPEKSLAIQSEIVRILDKFTALTAELTAELNMRKKQYNYYRDQLLRFKEGEVEWKALDDVFDIVAGGDAPKDALSEFETEEFSIPVLSNGIGNKSLYGWTDRAKIEKPSLTISARGTIGWTSYRSRPFFPIVRLLVLTPKIKLNLKYAYYFMKTIENNYKIPEAGIPQLTKPMLKDIKIPFPCPGNPEESYNEQARIAATLDKFDVLTNSITEGLPREIELRQKQYEYYRDLLFSFPKPETVSN